MSTLSLKTMICDCDLVGIEDPCVTEVQAEKLGEMRDKAKATGWRSMTIPGVGIVDLCPEHAKRYLEQFKETDVSD
jgi:hypothetical protein